MKTAARYDMVWLTLLAMAITYAALRYQPPVNARPAVSPFVIMLWPSFLFAGATFLRACDNRKPWKLQVLFGTLAFFTASFDAVLLLIEHQCQTSCGL